MIKIGFIAVILLSLLSCSENGTGQENDKKEESGWQLVWNDEGKNKSVIILISFVI